MRYFTKEWFEREDLLYWPVRVSAKAQFFSEEYFQAIYKRKLKKWLKDMRAAWELDMAEGLEEAPWNEEQEKADFERYFQNDIHTLQTSLPEEVLSMATDIRVLALRMGTRQVKTAITRCCRENEKRAEAPFKEYRRHLKILQEKHPLPFIRHLKCHDGRIEEIAEQNGCLEILVRHPYQEGEVRLRFENGHILQLDEPVHGAEWMYEEFHEAEQGFELHVLSCDEENAGEMIVQFENLFVEEYELNNP